MLLLDFLGDEFRIRPSPIKPVAAIRSPFRFIIQKPLRFFRPRIGRASDRYFQRKKGINGTILARKSFPGKAKSSLSTAGIFKVKLFCQVLPCHHYILLMAVNTHEHYCMYECFIGAGSGCSTVVEHTPHDREVMGSYPAFFSSLSFSVSLSIYQWCVLNQVPHRGATLLKNACSAVQLEA